MSLATPEKKLRAYSSRLQSFLPKGNLMPGGKPFLGRVWLTVRLTVGHPSGKLFSPISDDDAGPRPPNARQEFEYHWTLV